MFDIVDDLDSNKWEQKEAPANYDADKASKYLIIRQVSSLARGAYDIAVFGMCQYFGRY